MFSVFTPTRNDTQKMILNLLGDQSFISEIKNKSSFSPQPTHPSDDLKISPLSPKDKIEDIMIKPVKVLKYSIL